MEGNVQIKRGGAGREEALLPANAARGYRDESPAVAAASPRHDDNQEKNPIQKTKRKVRVAAPAVKRCEDVKRFKLPETKEMKK